MPHHILLLGATGPSGLTFAETALAAGHQLTLYARNPSKFSPSIQSHANVKIVEGEFSDSDKVKEALSSSATILVSVLGPSIPLKYNGTPVTHFHSYSKTLFPSLLDLKKSGDSKIERILICSTPSFHSPNNDDSFSPLWLFCVSLIRIFKAAWDEVRGIGTATCSLDVKEIPWTVFRVPILTNGEAKATKARFVGKGAGLVLGRKSMAVWLLQEMEEGKWIGLEASLRPRARSTIATSVCVFGIYHASQRFVCRSQTSDIDITQTKTFELFQVERFSHDSSYHARSAVER
ncbi:hypothetical protein AC579_161 [Pseudocercospora musae]|uniref:NAD(P)-binding domain-containing protein n=1 Tax=Pseudocercospora musae TaxID=113226 RepID=A0A139IAI6_9PEZI|nr:hypothetical protein AC579_161 [Pseudocercospora musae]KXT11605.1 hypothetical protein AC579_161 [Pseudocercospora musae]